MPKTGESDNPGITHPKETKGMQLQQNYRKGVGWVRIHSQINSYRSTMTQTKNKQDYIEMMFIITI